MKGGTGKILLRRLISGNDSDGLSCKFRLGNPSRADREGRSGCRSGLCGRLGGEVGDGASAADSKGVLNTRVLGLARIELFSRSWGDGGEEEVGGGCGAVLDEGFAAFGEGFPFGEVAGPLGEAGEACWGGDGCGGGDCHDCAGCCGLGWELLNDEHFRDMLCLLKLSVSVSVFV